VEEVEELLVPEEQVKIRVINFRETVVQSTAVLLSQPSPVEGKILEATFHFPPGCVALVDVAFGVLRGSRWESIVPDKALETGTFLALDNTLKSYPVNEPIEAGQRIWVYIRNRDGFWPHTPTITATLQGVVKVPDREY
jgi:hypothetical protein